VARKREKADSSPKPRKKPYRPGDIKKGEVGDIEILLGLLCGRAKVDRKTLMRSNEAAGKDSPLCIESPTFPAETASHEVESGSGRLPSKNTTKNPLAQKGSRISWSHESWKKKERSKGGSGTSRIALDDQDYSRSRHGGRSKTAIMLRRSRSTDGGSREGTIDSKDKKNLRAGKIKK